jgi:hypothetical protein
MQNFSAGWVVFLADFERIQVASRAWLAIREAVLSA